MIELAPLIPILFWLGKTLATPADTSTPEQDAARRTGIGQNREDRERLIAEAVAMLPPVPEAEAAKIRENLKGRETEVVALATQLAALARGEA